MNDSNTTARLNAEIHRRDTLPPFASPAVAIPDAFVEYINGFAKVCCYHGRTHEDKIRASREATDWATAHGWRVTHGMCADCSAREMAALRALPVCRVA